MVEKELLELLGCPLHPERPPFREVGDYLVCTEAGHGFPVVDGIPHLLPEDVIPAERIQELVNGR